MSGEMQASSREVAEQLHSASIHLLRMLRREDEDGSLNAPRLSALAVIVFAGPITLGDLAAAEQVRPPTITRIVHALEQQGLVVREKNAEDGRSVYLSATTAGKRLLVKSRSRRIRLLVEKIEQLPASEQSLLSEAARILRKLVARA
jgi:DNA-binding MarR family transcriptional regulator